MCNVTGIIFGVLNLTPLEIRGKDVLEVGALDVNGSLQRVLKAWKPKKYIGVDIEMGPGVDKVCDILDIKEKFQEKFDIVISTETMEHVRDWRAAIHNLKAVTKPGGIILITTRSIGFFYHAYPHDYWRYEPGDMEQIFSDCKILALESDPYPGNPGVFVKIKKPANFKENNLKNIKLHSVVVGKRVKDITETDFRKPYYLKLIAKERLKDFILGFGKASFGKI